ncbi:MAG: helix-turn-helix domain-containing protein [Clostridia bacterium]|nr:helix-turn-helix domain-containing protein [Clostridia bacterium]MBR4116849.1 helix-turn-helix domain-containing protein [Clostridia bacterium]
MRENFARNLTHYRKASGLTQTELAEKLNYSDKSVSKWERGDGLPDLTVTAQIAEIFGLTVNDLIADKPRRKLMNTHNKIIITLLSMGIAWLVATVLFFLFEMTLPGVYNWWLLYIYAIPISAIVGIVFSCIWWKKIHIFASISTLIWSVALCIMLTVSVFIHEPKIYLIFIVAAVVQVMTILWFLIKKH